MKRVVIGNGMVGHKLRKELVPAWHADEEIAVLGAELLPARGCVHGLRAGECLEVSGRSAQQRGDDAQVPVR